jgi:hypothetical protein
MALSLTLILAGCTALPNPVPSQPPAPSAFASPTDAPSGSGSPTAILIAAGDVASCSTIADEETGVLIEQLRDAAASEGRDVAVALLGDGAYPNGTAAEWSTCYGSAWGSFKEITYPAVGNHEYLTDGAEPYFSYFGAAAGSPGKGWYSYAIGAWRIIVLNSECDLVGCSTGSGQYRWLVAELARARAAGEPIAAMWHRPRFSTGEHGDARAMQPIWSALAMAGTAFVLNGHEHNYERWVPLTANGTPTTKGTTEFIVGTGGADLRAQRRSDSQSVMYVEVHGVIKLNLTSDAYSWEMISVDGSVADHGRVLLAP